LQVLGSLTWPCKSLTVLVRHILKRLASCGSTPSLATIFSVTTAIIAVYQLPGSNAVEAAKGVRAYMEEQKKRFPPGLAYTTAQGGMH
jgi:hypothetical protein